MGFFCMRVSLHNLNIDELHNEQILLLSSRCRYCHDNLLNVERLPAKIENAKVKKYILNAALHELTSLHNFL
jgi:hypothetical protein